MTTKTNNHYKITIKKNYKFPLELTTQNIIYDHYPKLNPTDKVTLYYDEINCAYTYKLTHNNLLLLTVYTNYNNNTSYITKHYP